MTTPKRHIPGPQESAECGGPCESIGPEACDCPQSDPREPTNAQLLAFGQAIWEQMKSSGFFGSEESEHWLAIAEDLGMTHRAKYDPNIHGQIEDAEVGDWVRLLYPKSKTS